MLARRLRRSSFALLLAAFGAQQAHAGLFDDDEARRQINDLTIKTNERLDTTAKAQFELANQIQALREENARLRGQLETLSYELGSANKRQQDFYVDLDGRLRKFETQAQQAAFAKPVEDAKASDESAQQAPADPAVESRDYEAALKLFTTGKLKEAANAFAVFVDAYSDSPLTPSAQYWLGNAYYALHSCKQAIDAQRVVLAKWPRHAKAPDALLNIATCQQALGEAKSAKDTLETVVIKYPNSPAAVTAKQRLHKK
jgi:tol-pal system protein YbgF